MIRATPMPISLKAPSQGPCAALHCASHWLGSMPTKLSGGTFVQVHKLMWIFPPTFTPWIHFSVELQKIAPAFDAFPHEKDSIK